MKRLVIILALTRSLFAALPSTQEALVMAFPSAQLQRRECFLTDAQVERVKTLSGTDLQSHWWVAYEARNIGRLEGVAFIDTHRVRTLNETSMVAVKADGTLKRVEVVAFQEPQEYLPREAWIRQLDGKALDSNLNLNRSIRPLSGATLTARTLVDAAKRGLALFQVLYGGTR